MKDLMRSFLIADPQYRPRKTSHHSERRSLPYIAALSREYS
jgi:hypothetical protein